MDCTSLFVFECIWMLFSECVVLCVVIATPASLGILISEPLGPFFVATFHVLSQKWQCVLLTGYNLASSLNVDVLDDALLKWLGIHHQAIGKTVPQSTEIVMNVLCVFWVCYWCVFELVGSWFVFHSTYLVPHTAFIVHRESEVKFIFILRCKYRQTIQK